MSKSNKTKVDEKPDVDNVEEQMENQDAMKEEQAAGTEKKESKKEEEELNTKYLRLAADFQNYKRRVEKEKSDIYACANERIVAQLLDVIDNFERALEHSDSGMESFTEGMGLIFKQFKGVLEKSGVEEIPAEGEQFDPNYLGKAFLIFHS